MRTRHTGPSLLSTLGQALNFHHNPNRHPTNLRQQHDPRASKHEYLVAERLFLLLDSLTTEKRLSFTWLKQAVTVVSSTVSAAQEILPQLQCPLSQWDEQWVSSYLEDTVRLLDVLNFVRKLLVELEHRQMLLKLVVTTLNSASGTVEDRRSKARKCLTDHADGESEVKVATKVADCPTILQEMISQTFEERLNTFQKSRSFLSVLYGSKVVAVFLLGIVVRGLGGTVQGFGGWHVPERFAWSKPLEELLQQVSKLAGDDKGNPTDEFRVLDQELQNLCAKLDSDASLIKTENQEVKSITGGAAVAVSAAAEVEQEKAETTEGEITSSEHGKVEQMDCKIMSSDQATRDDAWGLQIALKNAEEGVDSVRKEVDILFHAIVSSRNSLLARLRS